MSLQNGENQKESIALYKVSLFVHITSIEVGLRIKSFIQTCVWNVALYEREIWTFSHVERKQDL